LNKTQPEELADERELNTEPPKPDGALLAALVSIRQLKSEAELSRLLSCLAEDDDGECCAAAATAAALFVGRTTRGVDVRRDISFALFMTPATRLVSDGILRTVVCQITKKSNNSKLIFKKINKPWLK